MARKTKIEREQAKKVRMSKLQELTDRSTTVERAKELYHELYLELTKCPVCDRIGKVTIESITSTQAHLLKMMADHCQKEGKFGEYIHMGKLCQQKGARLPAHFDSNFPKLRHWGFIEKDPDKKEDGNPSTGKYRLTIKGFNFVQGKITVKKWLIAWSRKAYVSSKRFDNDPDGDQFINIHDAERNKFKYDTHVKGGKENVE